LIESSYRSSDGGLLEMWVP